jgi:hypothetical protein
MDISELLAFVVKNKASDLHLSAGRRAGVFFCLRFPRCAGIDGLVTL